MRLPREIGPIHFVGIGGIGMSGIAEVLSNLGYTVQGSDASESANVTRLRDKGISISVGHKAENVAGADVLVVSTAIRRDNPELMAARAQRIPVVRRAEMLAELMRLKSCVAIGGTHGKTTTTSMVAALLDAGDLDPTVINGGIINAYGTNARLGAGEWMVVEADESDGTFLKLPTDVAIVTNVDPEHLDHFKTFEAVQDAFRSFVENVPFYGFAVMCIDHPVVQTIVGKIEDRRIITYGENPQADARLLDLRAVNAGSTFKVAFRDRKAGTSHEIADLVLPMPGRHNALNATAAIAVAHELGLSDDMIRKALAGFGGVRRRFTKTGEWNGVTIIDDYGHHPVEISAVLRAARESINGKVIAVVQPHRFTRLQSLFEEFCTCFNDADTVVVAEVYPAGEAPIPGIDRDHFVLGLRAHGHREVIPLAKFRRSCRRGARRCRPRRLCGLPRRRQHHAMGLRAAGRTEGAGLTGVAMMILSEQTWRRHANPWSVWTRYAAFPLLVAAIWSHHWIGWGALLPVAIMVGFIYVNPWLFPPPRSTRSWASKAVLGERVWLAEDKRYLPDQHPRVVNVLIALSFANLAALVWGLVQSDAVLTIVSTVNVLVAKSWFNDRMVWLFSERVRGNAEYQSWLH